MPGARDGQLRVRRGTDSPPWGLDLYDDGAAQWRDVAYALGVPVLRGPYVVDYTDIPHDGDTKVLWTPQVGDFLLRLFPDVTGTGWDSGALFIGQNVNGTVTPALNVIATTPAFGSGLVNLSGMDNITSAVGEGARTDGSGTTLYASAYIFHSTDPVQIQLAQTGGTDPTMGHVELYALVARAVAP